MSGKPLSAWHWLRSVGAAVLFLTIVGAFTDAQVSRVERTIHAPKNVVEKALKQLQSATSGRLPALEGFAEAGDRPLSRYRRGYFQCAVQVSAMPSGDSLVKVSAKVTAWYDAAGPAHSGYELLRSNGRIETDLLDQIVEQLSGNAVSAGITKSSTSAETTESVLLFLLVKSSASYSGRAERKSTTSEICEKISVRGCKMRQRMSLSICATPACS